MASNDKDIVKQAHTLFAQCEEAESENRRLWREDLRFANGDSDNLYQWDAAQVKARNTSKLPTLTINKVKQHNLQITNEAKKNRSSPKVIAVGNGADKDTAEIFNGIIRHIEAQSSADIAYGQAFEFAVDAGLGYWLVTTEYADENSFDQEIFIVPVENPLNVFLYGNKKADGSDATAGFVFEDMPKAAFKSKYPKANERDTWEFLDGGWRSDDTIRVCEYYYIDEEKDTLIAGQDGNPVLLSTLEDKSTVDKSAKQRKVTTKHIKWCIIAGDEVLERRDCPGKYIPIVRVVGEEKVIDGKVVRKGHTRGMKDPQRMYNFWASSAAAFVSAQGKTPWVIAAEAVAGYEGFWETANTDTHAYLPWQHKDAEGNPLPAPQRAQPPTMAQAYIQGMQIASDEMQAASGQYDAQLGENANQQSGRALTALQRKGDNATFHFTDSSDIAKLFTCQILIDLIPRIYDTARVVRMLGEDGTEDKAELDPDQPQAHVEHQDNITGETKNIYNLSVGRYDVIPSSGPSYATKRQEAAEGMIAMSQANPAIWQTHGDIIVKSQDWPMADEFAKRFEKTLPPGLLDDDKNKAPDPQVQQLTQQIQQMDNAIQKMTDELDAKDLERQKVEIDRYNAETSRLKTILPSMLPAQAHAVALQTLDDLNTPDTMAEREEMATTAQPTQPQPAGPMQ